MSKQQKQPMPKIEDCNFNCSGGYKPVVVLAKLPADKKQRLWAGIKTSRPELANFLSTDQTYAALKAGFEASLILTEAEYHELSN